jgi:hypothetical protein
MFELFMRLCVGALAVFSGDGAFRSEEARQIATARASTMPATEALVHIFANPLMYDQWPPSKFSNGILVGPWVVLTHNHAKWALGDWVVSPYKGFNKLTRRIEIGREERSSFVVNKDDVPSDSMAKVIDIHCYLPGKMPPAQGKPQGFMAWQSYPKAYRNYTIGNLKPDICLLKVDKPFVGLHIPEVGSVNFVKEPTILTVLGGHRNTFLYDGSSSDEDLVWQNHRSLRALRKSEGDNSTYEEVDYPIRRIAFTQPIYDHGHFLVAEARLGPEIPGQDQSDRFIPTEEDLEGILQGGLSGSPILWNNMIVGVAYAAPISSDMIDLQNMAAHRGVHKQLESRNESHERFSAANTYYPLYNVYSHLTELIQDWMRSVMGSGNPPHTVSAGVSPLGNTVMSDDRDNDGHPWGH